ncbi:MAG: heme ABC transporter permease, partial [Gammaproteobacteria bacterium]|nr:heme ABC transporter permease [Gammaproteobacteria bacterium]
LENAIDDPQRASRASALLGLVGIVNIPIIYFSVKWWNTLHQGMSVSTSGISMEPSMKIAMFTLAFAVWFYTIAIALTRVRSIILERERHAAWVVDLAKAGGR